MNNFMNDNEPKEERTINDEELANLRAIFDRDRIIETDADLLELAKLVEDESDESDLVIDHDVDPGAGN